jgi:alpha-1,3-rhamnosyl/mannosyltransferase
MKVILAIDAIQPELTGIGRYAYELARRLPGEAGIEAVRYFSRGRWIGDVEARRIPTAARSAIIRLLLRTPLVPDLYRTLAPHFLRHRLAPYADHLYHSPNFYLPPGAGPAIATLHDLSVYRCPQFQPAWRVNHMRKEMTKTLARATALITDSEFTRQEVISFFGWPADRIHAVALGVGPEYHPRDAAATASVLGEFDLNHGGYTLCVATIEPRKNLENLLAAYAALPQTSRRCYPLVLAGGTGWKAGPIHRRMEQGLRAGWIRYLGFVAEAQLPALFAGAHAFAFPSWYEGFGLPVAEAMATGLPVLTANQGSLPEVARGAALLVEPGDVPAMTAALRILLEDKDWRLAAATRALAAAPCTWEATVRNTVAVYRAVLDA